MTARELVQGSEYRKIPSHQVEQQRSLPFDQSKPTEIIRGILQKLHIEYLALRNRHFPDGKFNRSNQEFQTEREKLITKVSEKLLQSINGITETEKLATLVKRLGLYISANDIALTVPPSDKFIAQLLKIIQQNSEQVSLTKPPTKAQPTGRKFTSIQAGPDPIEDHRRGTRKLVEIHVP